MDVLVLDIQDAVHATQGCAANTRRLYAVYSTARFIPGQIFKRFGHRAERDDDLNFDEEKGGRMDAPGFRYEPYVYSIGMIVTWQVSCGEGRTGFLVILRTPPWENQSSSYYLNTTYQKHQPPCLLQQLLKTTTGLDRYPKTDNCIGGFIMNPTTVSDSGGGIGLDPLFDLSPYSLPNDIDFFGCDTLLQDLPSQQLYFASLTPQIDRLETSSSTTFSSRKESDSLPSMLSPHENKSQKRLACPFFKSNPNLPGRAQACRGPGFPDIAKLKEHLRRRHCPKENVCERCREKFDDHDALCQHRRSPESCQLVNITTEDAELLTTGQQKLLHKRTPRNKSQAETWSEIYRMIFNLDKSSPTPSPYCERSRITIGRIDKRALGAGFSQYLSRSEVQEQLRGEIESTLGFLTGPGAKTNSLVSTFTRLAPSLLERCCSEQLSDDFNLSNWNNHELSSL